MDVLDVRLESTSNDLLWMEKYRRLEASRKAFGNCNVPRSVEDKSLSFWVANQRSFYRAGTLRNDRERLLTELGFIWRRKVPWIDRYGELVAFKQKHGHFRVPVAEDSALNSWLNYQRVQYRSGKLRKEWIDLLEKVEFPWNSASTTSTGPPSAVSITQSSTTDVPASSTSTLTEASGTGGSLPGAASSSEMKANKTPTTKMDLKFAIGTRIEKVFDVDGMARAFGGSVTACELFQEEDGTQTWGYMISYDDGDEEHMLEADVARNLAVVKNMKRASKSQTKPKAFKRRKQGDLLGKDSRSVALKKTSDFFQVQANRDGSGKQAKKVHVHAKRCTVSEARKALTAEGISRLSHMQDDAKPARPARDIKHPPGTNSHLARANTARERRPPSYYFESYSSLSEEESLYSPSRKPKPTVRTGAKKKSIDKKVLPDVIDLVDSDDSTESGSLRVSTMRNQCSRLPSGSSRLVF